MDAPRPKTLVAPKPKTLAAKPKKTIARKFKSEAPPGPGPAINAEERQMMIERAAYFRAERRGFAPGSELEDWFEAEAEVLQLIGG
jgi:hypothetical protein